MEGCREKRKRVLWWGAQENEYGWLRGRIAEYNSPLTPKIELLTITDSWERLLEILESQQADRLVVAYRNRWDYSHLKMQQLVQRFPEIPVALALGDWWLGWRRTSIGHLQTLPHLSLPWYRWWDGWRQWLEGRLPSMLGPFPSDRVVVDLETDWHAQSQSEWLVWDDSQLATWMGWEASLNFAIEQLVELQKENPRSKLCIAWTLPTWEVVSSLKRAGLCFELIAKPHLSSFSSAALERT
jgi:hypothetical protein